MSNETTEPERIGKDQFRAKIHGVQVDFEYSLPGRWFYDYDYNDQHWHGDSDSLENVYQAAKDEIEELKAVYE